MEAFDFHFFFDILICGFLAADGFLVFLTIRRVMRIGFSKSPHLIFAAGFLAIMFVMVFWGSFIEPQRIIVRQENLTLEKISSGLPLGKPSETIRAAVISDLHIGPYKREDFLKRVVSKIAKQKPDVIFIVGDFISYGTEGIQFLDPLRDLRAPLGVFAVLGNHDYGTNKRTLSKPTEQAALLTSKLKELGITVLINQTAKLTKGTKYILLIGTDELWTNRASIGKALQTFAETKSQKNKPFVYILLSHNPDMVKKAEVSKLELVISGHTHGGQIRLPLWGSVARIPDTLGRKYDKGFFSYGKTGLYITSGLGEIGPRARLFNPPEIVMLNINF